MRGSTFLSLMVAGLFAFLTGCSARHVDWANNSAPAGTGFQTKSFEFEGSSQNYTVFIPHNYKANGRYPVIMFLHGVLEGGSNGKKCVTVGLGPAVSERASTFPFIVVFPQSTNDWQGDHHSRLAIATLDQVLKDYPAADRNHVILTGLSNGGDGTWSIGARYTNRFAGLVPMCGAPDLDDASRLTGIPIWCFHNSLDPFRSCGKAEEMCDRISKAGGNVKFTKYNVLLPEHDCWSKAYSEGEVFQWMLGLRGVAQQRPAPSNSASTLVP